MVTGMFRKVPEMTSEGRSNDAAISGCITLGRTTAAGVYHLRCEGISEAIRSVCQQSLSSPQGRPRNGSPALPLGRFVGCTEHQPTVLHFPKSAMKNSCCAALADLRSSCVSTQNA